MKVKELANRVMKANPRQTEITFQTFLLSIYYDYNF